MKYHKINICSNNVLFTCGEASRRSISRLSSPSSIWLIQGQSLTVTPFTVTVGYSDTFSDSQTITNGFQAVTVTSFRSHSPQNEGKMAKIWSFGHIHVHNFAQN